MEGILFISELPSEVKNAFRRLEQINKKVISCRSSLLFNNACLNNNIQLKYTNKLKQMNHLTLLVLIFTVIIEISLINFMYNLVNLNCNHTSPIMYLRKLWFLYLNRIKQKFTSK